MRKVFDFPPIQTVSLWRSTSITLCGGSLQPGRLFATEELDHLVPNDPDDGLGGSEALEDFLAGRLHADPVEELLRDLEMDVRFEQGQADLAQGGVHVRHGQGPLPAEGAEHPFELVAESVEHGGEILPAAARAQSPAHLCHRLKAK